MDTLENFAWAFFIAGVAAYLVWRLIDTFDKIRSEINEDEDK